MLTAKAEANENAKREVDAVANAKAARKAAEEEEEKQAEAERNALALRILTEIDPPLVTEEQIAEAKTALTPAPPGDEAAAMGRRSGRAAARRSGRGQSTGC